MMRPSGKSFDGGRYAIALMNAEPCDTIVSSYSGGEEDLSRQLRTVASREAERRVSRVGKVMPLTWGGWVC